MTRAQKGDKVKVHYTGRLDDGRVFERSTERGPLELTLGEQPLIPGFEEAITQMEPGEERTLTIPAEQAYGPRRPELVLEVERANFPEHIQPEVGQELEVRQNDGRTLAVRVADVSPEQVTLDANHPLAGENLTFDLELVEVSKRE